MREKRSIAEIKKESLEILLAYEFKTAQAARFLGRGKALWNECRSRLTHPGIVANAAILYAVLLQDVGDADKAIRVLKGVQLPATRDRRYGPALDAKSKLVELLAKLKRFREAGKLFRELLASFKKSETPCLLTLTVRLMKQRGALRILIDDDWKQLEPLFRRAAEQLEIKPLPLPTNLKEAELYAGRLWIAAGRKVFRKRK